MSLELHPENKRLEVTYEHDQHYTRYVIERIGNVRVSFENGIYESLFITSQCLSLDFTTKTADLAITYLAIGTLEDQVGCLFLKYNR